MNTLIGDLNALKCNLKVQNNAKIIIIYVLYCKNLCYNSKHKS